MEAKFRGKRIEGPEGWAYGSHLEYGGRHFICSICYIGVKPQFTYVEVAGDSVGMWTGLVDKKDVEVYSGDLLSWHDSMLEVKWGTYRGEFTLFSKMFSKFGRPDGDDCGMYNGRTYIIQSEVIGNTTDDPELLKD